MRKFLRCLVYTLRNSNLQPYTSTPFNLYSRHAQKPHQDIFSPLHRVPRVSYKGWYQLESHSTTNKITVYLNSCFVCSEAGSGAPVRVVYIRCFFSWSSWRWDEKEYDLTRRIRLAQVWLLTLRCTCPIRAENAPRIRILRLEVL